MGPPKEKGISVLKWPHKSPQRDIDAMVERMRRSGGEDCHNTLSAVYSANARPAINNGLFVAHFFSSSKSEGVYAYFPRSLQ